MGLEQELEQYQGHIKKGDVVYVLFPFAAHQQIQSLEDNPKSNVEQKQKPQVETENGKERTALVLFRSDTNNFVFCSITEHGHREPSIPLSNKDLKPGGHLGYNPSYIKPNIISTIDKKLVRRKLGELKTEKLAEVLTKVKDLLDIESEEIPVSKALERPKRRVR